MDPLDWEQDSEEERKIEKWKPTDPESILEDGEMLDVEEIYDQGSEEGEIIERAVVDERRRALIYSSKMGQASTQKQRASNSKTQLNERRE